MAIIYTKDIGWHLRESQLGAEAISFVIEVDISDSSVKESMLKDWLPTIFVGYEEPLPIERVDSRREVDSSNQSVNGWIAQIRNELYHNTSVEDIFVTVEDNDIDVWVVIPHRDIAALRQIIEKEDELLKILVSGENPALFIDFHVIYRCGRNIEELAPTRAIRIPKEV